MSTKHMVETQVKPRGVSDPLVLNAMEKVQRNLFVPKSYQRYAFSDNPLPILAGQTISQPYMVAAMTEMLSLTPTSRVLEIGTGSGYQTAILAEIAAEVFTVEIIESLATSAKTLLTRLGYEQIRFKTGNGKLGWPEYAPFDAIIVTAAPDVLPETYASQLKEGGRLVIPVGPQQGVQQLYRYEKKAETTLEGGAAMAVRFVPLTDECPPG